MHHKGVLIVAKPNKPTAIVTPTLGLRVSGCRINGHDVALKFEDGGIIIGLNRNNLVSDVEISSYFGSIISLSRFEISSYFRKSS